MLPTTILIDENPRCVVRPVDTKDLNRFLRNAKAFLLAQNPSGKVTHRTATEAEQIWWREAFSLHKAWGGEDEAFFGVPVQKGEAERQD